SSGSPCARCRTPTGLASRRSWPRSASSRADPPSSMADVVVAGAAGRMGSRLVALLQQETELRLVAALESPGHAALGRDAGESAGVGRLDIPIGADVDAVLGKDRILMEFSVPEASLAHARLAGPQGRRAVIGTTGFTAAPRRA